MVVVGGAVATTVGGRSVRFTRWSVSVPVSGGGGLGGVSDKGTGSIVRGGLSASLSAGVKLVMCLGGFCSVVGSEFGGGSGSVECRPWSEGVVAIGRSKKSVRVRVMVWPFGSDWG